jgi:antitoxin (DNA-binding transcriptional repressor) of toxin-antitoxin stability system
MKKLTIREVRAALTRLDEVVAEEGEILIMRRGRALARVLPVRSIRRLPSHADLRARMPRLIPSETLVRQDRDER